MERRKLFHAALTFSIILFLWPLFAAISIPAGNLQEQLAAIMENPLIHILNFIVALFIAPVMVWMLIRLYPFLSNHLNKNILGISIFFYAIYLVLISISYGSQVFYFPLLLDNHSDPRLMSWFFYNDRSHAILINQTAYLAWSLGSLFYFIPGVIHKKGIFRISMIIFILSAILQAAASSGMYTGVRALADLSFVSGILLLPAGILLIIFSAHKKRATSQAAN